MTLTLIHVSSMRRLPLTTLVLAERVLKQGQKLDRPAVDRGMINTHATLLHHFF